MAGRNGHTDPTWTILVTGPGQDGKAFPNIGSALAYAMHEAGRMPEDCVDCTWYVRGEGRTLFVERQGPNVVYRERVPVTS